MPEKIPKRKPRVGEQKRSNAKIRVAAGAGVEAVHLPRSQLALLVLDYLIPPASILLAAAGFYYLPLLGILITAYLLHYGRTRHCEPLRSHVHYLFVLTAAAIVSILYQYVCFMNNL